MDKRIVKWVEADKLIMYSKAGYHCTTFTPFHNMCIFCRNKSISKTMTQYNLESGPQYTKQEGALIKDLNTHGNTATSLTLLLEVFGHEVSSLFLIFWV